MKSGTKILITIGAIACIPILVLAYFSLPWILISIGVWLSPDPPKPEIQYGEFPFQIVYELDGEVHIIEDVYVCEYEGIDANEGVGKYIKWKGYFQGTGEEELVLLRRGTTQIVCSIGSPDYYMGDDDYLSQEMVPDLIAVEDYESITSAHVLTDQEKEQYRIELISWELPKPIVNTFE